MSRTSLQVQAGMNSRKITSIGIMPLYMDRTDESVINNAIMSIGTYMNLPDNLRPEFIEVVVAYSNGSIVRGQFRDKEGAVDFLYSISS